MITKSKKQLTAKQAFERLETLCARSEQCKHELRQKLWKWGISGEDADKIIDSLVERRYVDEERFVRSFVNDKIRFSRWGERKIQAALMSKRIDAETVRHYLEEFDHEIIENNLRHLLNCKATNCEDAKTYEGRTRLFRYGVSRGYSPSMVAKIIKENFI